MKNSLSLKFAKAAFSLCGLLLLSSCNQQSFSETANVTFLNCSPFAARIEKEEFYQHTECGTMDEMGLMQLEPDTIKLMDFPALKAWRAANPKLRTRDYPDDMMCLPISDSIGNGYYLAYFTKEGKGRASVVFDASCTPFLNGMAYTYINGNIAYIDTNLDIIKMTDYRFALGRTVCTDPPRKFYKPGHFEHPEWIGGKCGFLDRELNVSIPIEYEIQNIPIENGAL